ncbi:MAG: hypothetical protein JRI23_34485 [Deltaproteobacteria bacterium]|jgi:hypothetical protein|nr:hypothetical protein [Deltaproteobacteria bacterium]MBW2537407.1 hypothetical protein [Deltaproteobacteria bacterium]
MTSSNEQQRLRWLGPAVAVLLLAAACTVTSDFEGLSDQFEAGLCSGDAACDDDNPCTDDRCDGSSQRCVHVPRSDDTAPAAEQRDGDCRKIVCNAGEPESSVDDSDVPDDGNDCTEGMCWSGEPVSVHQPPGQLCGSDDGSFCDGAGQCVECNGPSDCPGVDDECSSRTCVDHQCGVARAVAGTEVALQVPGDCHRLECDGAGEAVKVLDLSDVPSDADDCTEDLCSEAGEPSNEPMVEGSSCGLSGTCDADGLCVGCVDHADCVMDGMDAACVTFECLSNVCSIDYAALGTMLESQTDGDCQQRVCNGQGQAMSVANDADTPPEESNPCKLAVCQSGTAAVIDAASGTICGPATCEDTSTQLNVALCNGQGTCIPSVQTSSCGYYLCIGNSGCAVSCIDDTQCSSSAYCRASRCEPKLSDGQPCTGANACQSGFCVDGLCCNGPCNATCMACDAANTGLADGLCDYVLADLDPHDDCTPQPVWSCGSTGTCDGAGACAKYPAGTLCGGARCDGNLQTNADYCNGAGNCEDYGVVFCGEYTCEDDGVVCRSTCLTHDHCAAGYYCDGSRCIPGEPDGTPCSEDGECDSGYCSDGVCCESECGYCGVCAGEFPDWRVGVADGICVFVPAGLDDPLTPCCGANVCMAGGTCQSIYTCGGT